MNPWFRVWFHPRKTLQNLGAVHRNFSEFFIAAATAAVFFLIGFAVYYAERSTLQGAFIAAFLIGGVLGFGEYFVFPFMLQLIGRMLGGKATLAQLRSVVTWSTLPLILAIAVAVSGIIGLVLMGFEFDPEQAKASHPIGLVLGINAILVVGSVWTLVLELEMLSEAQGFRVATAMVNYFLAGLAFLVPLFGLMIAFGN
jgi:hypothetical protein